MSPFPTPFQNDVRGFPSASPFSPNRVLSLDSGPPFFFSNKPFKAEDYEFKFFRVPPFKSVSFFYPSDWVFFRTETNPLFFVLSYFPF